MWKWATIIHATNTRWVLCIKASMAGAWFIHWLVQLVCGLCGPCTGHGNWTARVYSSLWLVDWTTRGLVNSWMSPLTRVARQSPKCDRAFAHCIMSCRIRFTCFRKRAMLCSMQLCLQNAEWWLVSHSVFLFWSFGVYYLLYLFNLSNLL